MYIYIYTNLEGHSHTLWKIIPNCPNFPIVQKQIHSSPVFFLLPKHFLLLLLFPPVAPNKMCWFFGGCICESLEKKRESVFAAWLRTSPWSPVAWLQKKTQEVQLPEAIGGGGWVGYIFFITWKKGGGFWGVFFYRFFGGWILRGFWGIEMDWRFNLTVDECIIWYVICGIHDIHIHIYSKNISKQDSHALSRVWKSWKQKIKIEEDSDGSRESRYPSYPPICKRFLKGLGDRVSGQEKFLGSLHFFLWMAHADVSPPWESLRLNSHFWWILEKKSVVQIMESSSTSTSCVEKTPQKWLFPVSKSSHPEIPADLM